MKPLFWCLALLLASSPAHAAEEATPEAIIKRHIEAMRQLDWAKVAGYTHPKALAQLKALFLPIATASETATDNPEATQLMSDLFGGKTVRQLESEAPAAFFETVMNGIGSVVPDFKKLMQNMQADVLGHVKEGEFAAHVIYRLRRPAGEGSASKMAVSTVERDGDSWKALLNADLENVARIINSRLQAR